MHKKETAESAHFEKAYFCKSGSLRDFNWKTLIIWATPKKAVNKEFGINTMALKSSPTRAQSIRNGSVIFYVYTSTPSASIV